MGFRSLAEVEHWVAANGGVDALRTAVLEMRFAHGGQFANEWLKRHDKQLQLALQAQAAEIDRALKEREVQAAETAAEAAKRSARWAGWAVFISVTALALAAWPYISKLWE